MLHLTTFTNTCFQSEAGSVHSQELQTLRAESQVTIEQLQAAHQATINNLQAGHQAALETQVKSLEGKIASQNTELSAARDDLAKSKAALTSITQELESTKVQLEESKALIASLDKSDKDETITRLTGQLANVRQEHEVMQEMFQATNDSIREMSNKHSKDLEDAAQVRAEEVLKLQATHKEEVEMLSKDRVELTMQLADRENELNTLRATVAAGPETPSKSNGATPARETAVTKEELQKMHEAHNLKLGDLQAQHDRELRVLRDELDKALAASDDLNRQINQKVMEIDCECLCLLELAL